MALKSNFSMNSLLSGKITKSTEACDHSAKLMKFHGDVDIDVDHIENQDPERPQFTYISLITMAIRSSPTGKMTLNEIYNYIAENFPYYQHCKTQWKNSIRHNLSINKIFVKVPREYGEQGRGHYWTLSPEANDAYVGEDTGKLRYQNYLNHEWIHQQNAIQTLVAQQNLMQQRIQQQQYLMAQANVTQQQFYAEIAAMSGMQGRFQNSCPRQSCGRIQPCNCNCINLLPHFQFTQLTGSGFRY